MLKVRRANDRGHADHGWLNTYHTFSFADYYNPEFNGFRSLRVINEDRVAPGRGFDTHAHKNMEIISYVIDGALEHRDSTGNSTVIRKGEVQRMSAGTGVTHSEKNYSESTEVHFLQIWIQPEKDEISPSYAQTEYAGRCTQNELCLIASRDGRNGAITIHCDVNIYTCTLDKEETTAYRCAENGTRYQWIQVVNGSIRVNETELGTGDGCAASNLALLKIEAQSKSEFLLIDLN